MSQRTEDRFRATISRLQDIIVNLSPFLADEGHDVTEEYLAALRRSVANALPPSKRPDWLDKFGDPAVVASDTLSGE
jgi:hypothetical protein